VCSCEVIYMCVCVCVCVCLCVCVESVRVRVNPCMVKSFGAEEQVSHQHPLAIQTSCIVKSFAAGWKYLHIPAIRSRFLD
jgi:hypothetical protein